MTSTSFDKIICVGKNYLDHALELGDPVPEKPLFFFKPPSCLIENPGQPVLLPKNRGSVHHECEIVYRIRIDKGTPRFEAVTLGLDLTLRDVQNELKKKGAPWEAAKAFPNSAVIGPWINLDNHLDRTFQLSINGEIRQSAKGSMMRVNPESLLQMLAATFTLCDGDLLFTGTPKGVGPILSGDRLELAWEDKLRFEVVFQ